MIWKSGWPVWRRKHETAVRTKGAAMTLAAGTRVLVHYTGTLDDSTQFDSFPRYTH